MKTLKVPRLVLVVLCFSLVILGCQGQQCGRDVGGKECANKLCCSGYGYCGSTEAYCGEGCQSNCRQSPPPAPLAPPPPTPPSPITEYFPESLFDEFLSHRNDPACKGSFYTYYAFITAANDFPGFGTTGDLDTKKREIAAFFGQTSQETYGGWDGAPGGKYSWGYCWVSEVGCEGTPSPCTYCTPTTDWPCVNGKAYYGRGPIQLSYNYNYGQAGEALGLDLLNNPDLVAQDPVIAFKTAIWFWMTPQPPKPSAHDVITDQWTPTEADIKCGRLPGYGVITNIINGGVECGGSGPNPQVENRIEFYKRYCGILGVSPGDNLDCYNSCPFGVRLLLPGQSTAY